MNLQLLRTNPVIGPVGEFCRELEQCDKIDAESVQDGFVGLRQHYWNIAENPHEIDHCDTRTQRGESDRLDH